MRHLLILACLAALAAVPATASASDVIVQGTTDVRDAGLLNDVIVPGFQAAYPEYTVKYIAVGTGQALTNAQAGQGDAVLTHAPTLEAQFVANGFSALARQVFYSDYVIDGPQSDPAAVGPANLHNAAGAFSAIAAAGAAGKANFVSRGDNSGTNVQEKIIWALTNVPLNSAGEPAGANGTGNPSWYHKAGLGQADTVQLTNQCPFAGGGCYNMTDRGTFNRLVSLGSVTGLVVLADRNDASAPGGASLLLNPFSAYVVNQAAVPNVTINTAGATAFVNYLTSPELQARLASYPTTANPAFFADATPTVTVSQPVPTTATAGKSVTVSGTLANALPDSGPLSGVTVQLVNNRAPLAPVTVAEAKTDATGKFTFTGPLNRSGALQVNVPQFGTFTATTKAVGPLTLKAAVSAKATVRQHTVTLRGTARPASGRQKAVLYIRGHRAGSTHFSTLETVNLPASGGGSFRQSIKLKSGRWSLQLTYADPGNVTSATSRVVHVSVA
jgi:tungstate transport system substrate-binding protein